MHFETTTLIERPVAAVFEACDSAKLQIAWIGSLVEVQIPEGTRWCAGAKFRQIHEDSGMRQEFVGLLIDHVVPSRIEVELVHGDLSVHSVLSFEDLGERSRVSQETDVELHSMALKLVRPMVKAAIKQRLQEDFERLKTLLESDFSGPA